MSLNTVQEIERAIEELTPLQLAELYEWLDRYDPQPIDARIQADLAAGRLDNAIARALDDEKRGVGLLNVKLDPDARETLIGYANGDARTALNALKGPLGNIPAFRKKIQGLLGDAEGRQKLMNELGLSEEKK